MMEEYEAVMVLRGKIARGEVSLEDALKQPELAAAAAADPAADGAAVEGAGLDGRAAAVGNKVDDMLNASSDEEWNKMMEAYNKALSNNPV